MYESMLALSSPGPEPHSWYSALAAGSGADSILLACLAFQAGLGALLAVAAVRFLPQARAESRRPLALLLFGVGYAVPVLGFLGVLAGIFLSHFFRTQDRKKSLRILDIPELDSRQRLATGLRAAGLRSFLSNEEAPVATRLRALVALQNISGRVATPLLRNALADPSEDIRLLAYGLLDSQEKRINRAIHAQSIRLAAAPEGSPQHVAAARRLSGLYWELVYQRLVQGDLRLHALQQSLHYTRLALVRDPLDAALLLHQGRLAQKLGDLEGARSFYGRALSLGLPETRVVPYLAEAAYRLGDYETVRSLLSGVDRWCFRLRPVADYWCQR